MLKHKPSHLEDELCFAVYSTQKLYNRFLFNRIEKIRTYICTICDNACFVVRAASDDVQGAW